MMRLTRKAGYMLIAVLCMMLFAMLPAQAEELPLFDMGYPNYGYEMVPEGEPGFADGGTYVYAPHPSMDYTDYMFMAYVGYKPTEEETEGQPLVYTYPSGSSFGFDSDPITKAIVPAEAVLAGFSRNLELVTVDMSRAKKLKTLSLHACYNVKTLDVPYGVEAVILNHTTGLTRLTLPPTIRFLELWALDELTSLTIPDGVEYLSVRDCPKLQSLTIPRSVKAIFRHGFKGCSSLKSITFYGDPAPEFTSSTSPFKETPIRSINIKNPSSKNAKLWASRAGVAVNGISGRQNLTYVYGDERDDTLTDAVAGKTIKQPVKPVREGYTFSGWYQDEELTKKWDFSTNKMPSKALTLYAGWTKACQVRFSLNNGMRMGDEYVAPGKKIREPFEPTRDSYRFTGWYQDSACTKPWRFGQDVVTTDTEMTLYAGWKYVLAAGLTINGSEAIMGEIAVPQEEIVMPSVMAGKTIVGLGENCVPAGVKKLTIPAGITAIDEKAFIHAADLMEIEVDAGNPVYYAEEGVLYKKDGTLLCYPQAKSDTVFAVPDAVHAIGAYAFLNASTLNTLTFGADADIDERAFEGVKDIHLNGPSDAQKLTACAETMGFLYNQYTVRYICDGEIVKELLCRVGEAIPQVEEGEREADIFLGWRDDEDGGRYWDFAADVMPKHDLTLEAGWQPAFEYAIEDGEATITKYLGDSLYVKVPSGSEELMVTAIAPDAFDTLKGLTLVGDKNSAAQTFAEQYGCKFEMRTRTLSFETNGGTPVAPREFYATDAVELPQVIRYNHKLKGWYIDAELTRKYETWMGMPPMDLTLYAAWEMSSSSVPYECVVYGTGVKITKYVGSETNIVVPASIDGVPVRSVGEYAFSGATMTHIRFPDSISEIGPYAFKDCKNLMVATLPKTLSVIEEGLFEGCTSLLPNDFDYNWILSGRPIKRIGKRAFADSGLSFLYIPATVESIDLSAFDGCEALKVFSVEAGNKHYASGRDNAIYSSDMSTLVYYPKAKKETSITLPDTVKTIGPYAFYNHDTVAYITMPSVERLEEGAFKNCDELYVLVGADALKTIGDSAFENCKKLLTGIPKSALYIGSRAYVGCGDMYLTIGPNTQFADDAFDLEPLVAVYGVYGSPAHEWAKKHGIEFRPDINRVEGHVWLLFDQGYTEMETGKRMKLKYTLELDNAKDKTVEWSSSAPHIVSVDENGYVTALFEGTAVIRGTTTTFDGDSIIIDVKRGKAAAETVLLSEESLMLAVGDSAELEASVLPATADNAGLTWQSSNPNVVTCTDGVVTAVGDGMAIITASCGAVSAQCDVLVYQGITVLPESLTEIAEEAFAGSRVACVECPQGLKTIGKRAFADCAILVRISLGSEVQSIAEDAFEGCEHVVIYAPEESYAARWAKENDVAYQTE